jgi:hypothetical protein
MPYDRSSRSVPSPLSQQHGDRVCIGGKKISTTAYVRIAVAIEIADCQAEIRHTAGFKSVVNC